MNKKLLIAAVTLFISLTALAQRPESKKITVSGKVIEKGTELPLEYAVEMNNLINLELEGSIG